MSALTDSPLSRPEAAARPRPELRPAAPAPPRLGGLAFTALLVALLVGGLGGCLLLKTSLQEQAFELSSLRAEAERLGDHEAFLRAGLALRTTPAELARSAAALGMVANPYGAYLILPSGQVLGVNRPVNGLELLDMAPPAEAPAAESADPVSDPAAAAGAAGGTDPDPAAAGGEPGQVVSDPAVAEGQGEIAGAETTTEPTDPTEMG
ncbi:MAG: hypothetical protein LBL55_09925 [Propionibacteriaceae bacterium]|jgi:hypothetical protein|nr:hypothetical protein [Propionibacteriaceae bacterium]